MSYQALYRVWRPQTFDEMVGQTVIKETLKNAIKSNHINHAYLFTGPRGTGKTSAAKILAKAINCPNQTDGNPCNECEMCRLITEGQLGDVVEIDAASNNGVDEIRDLRENVRYAASQAKYKVYIIDEVHMLTTAAFNALLKTLEEPPEQVVFILATTEAHKIPATILSRTQRFDFQLYTDQELIGRMVEILDHDKIDYEEEALAVIARAANGGMRDTVSLLDQAISYNQKEITVETALEVSGSLNQIAFLHYIREVYEQKVEEALTTLKEQLDKGKQAARFIDELILFSRDMLITLHTNKNQTLLNENEIKPLKEEVPANFYYRLIDSLNETQSKMRFSTQSDLYIEVMTIQLAQSDSLGGVNPVQPPIVESRQSGEMINNLIDTVRDLEEKMAFLSQQLKGQEQLIDQLREGQPVNTLNITQSETTGVTQEIEEMKIPRKRPRRTNIAYQLNLNQVHHVLNEATHTHIRIIKGAWQRILEGLPPQERAKFIDTDPLAAGEEYVLISFPNAAYAGEVQNNQLLLKTVNQLIEQEANIAMKMIIVLVKEWPDIRKNYAILRKNNNNQPIPIQDEALESQAEIHQDVDDYPQEEDRADAEELVENSAENSIDDANQNDNQSPAIHTDELEADQVETTINTQDISQNEVPSFPPLNNDATEAEEDEGSPEIVQKAIELFGEENINIYYDR
ncbi:DNA polymerase III subunit gamma/tau [Aerococcaceae bacterium WGS1372]